MKPAEFIRRAVSGLRGSLESLTPTQRFACDLRSVDRFKERYWDFARDADREDLAARLEEILAELWLSGEPSVADTAIREITPDDEEFPGYRFSGTAESLMLQLGSALKARRLGTVESALESLDGSYETAFMYAQEADDDDETAPRLHVTNLGSAEHAAGVERWLKEVQSEIDARTSDLRDSQLRMLDKSNLSSYRCR